MWKRVTERKLNTRRRKGTGWKWQKNGDVCVRHPISGK